MRVVRYPYYTLMEEADEVTSFDAELKERAERLAYVLGTMSNGIGLAANQVGWLQRVFVVLSNLNEAGAQREPKFYVNPRVVESLGDATDIEGCLSFPGINGNVRRAERIKIVAQDLDGNEFEEEMSGLQARCFLHELDHLNGINFIDHLNEGDRRKVDPILKRLRKR